MDDWMKQLDLLQATHSSTSGLVIYWAGSYVSGAGQRQWEVRLEGWAVVIGLLPPQILNDSVALTSQNLNEKSFGLGCL